MNFTNLHKKTNEYKELKEKPHWQGPTAIKTTVKGRDIKPQEAINDMSIGDDLNRGRVAIFIDGLSLFHSALQLGIEIDYVKLLCRLTQTSRLLRAFFYTGVDASKEKQQGFLLWMRRNGYRVVTKDILAVSENGKKPNLNVEIAVDMITLAPYYDTAVLVSGDGDLAYAVNAVTSLGSRVEVIGLQSMTSDSLIDVADYFIDFDSIKQYIQKDSQVGYTYRSSSTSQL
ncbi:NYN domain-containing protein [Anabaena aphanizomenioides LEGE 00250]|uniref:NYN domain-containing protein n=1 Tax=Sphaerospermopsis aphanizomenoides LEGE 00250 TaxID=2777972 RepID=A0ABR9VCM4_9CYAN|nr:NYN domain-containing protein [Sphaerospermopsis aphanizomenoides]MBE9236244.1 NYN domain-containing protein [Sphaerospermopsis aphanizomenoides LEGE 00250]